MLARAMPKARIHSVPAPVGGWNARDSVDAMAQLDAVVLDNWFPTTGKVTVRKGYSQHATGLGGPVETLAELHAGTVRKLVAAANGNLWDATSPGAASSIGSGYTNDRWQWANFNGKIFLVNGADTPKDWDGTTLSNTAWTGPTLTELSGVNVFKNRLFFWKASSQSFWYAGINAVNGALTEFPLSRVAAFGGNLVAMVTWTIDSGSGLDDLAVFVMSSGDVVVYEGTDPGSASAWSLVGVYRISAPLGVRGFVNVGGDIMIMTLDDYVSLSKVLREGRIGASSKVSGAVLSATQSGGSYFGWQALLYPKGSMMIMNVPKSNSEFDQHVLNTSTGAWCRFTDIHANCWGIYNDNLYFGGDEVVYQADTGNTDNGDQIDASAMQAWNDFGSAYRKRITASRAVIESQGSVNFELGIGIDYAQPNIGSISAAAPSGAIWDTSPWDTTSWSADTRITNTWRVSKGSGQKVSPRLVVGSKQTVSWLRTDFLYETGTAL